MIVILFVSINVGTSIGDRIRGMAQSQSEGVASLPTPVPDDGTTPAPVQNGWKHVQVVAIATDPAFPDPRLTPTPEPPTPSPSPVPTATPRSAQASGKPDHASLRPIWDEAEPLPPAEEMPSAAPKGDDVGN